MNLKHSADVSAIAASMLLRDEEKEVLGRLPVGSAVVKLQGRWPRAFRIRIPHRPIPKGSVRDLELRERMRPYRFEPIRRDEAVTKTDSKPFADPEDATDRKAGSSDDYPASVQSLLTDVAADPLSGMVERYRRMGVSRRKGNAWKEDCIQRRLISTVDISTRSGRVVLLELTEEGKRTLRRTDVEVPDRSRWGGLEHEYWKAKVAEHLTRLGWTVSIEEPVNGYTDLIAQRGDEKVAVEIETGKSDWRANVVKNVKRGIVPILIVPTNEDTHREIAAAAANEYQGIDLRIIQAQEVVEQRNPTII